MAPPVDRVESNPVLPTETHVVVIGGGIIGACTAFFLARKGVPVVLCEKGEIAGEQSSRNWGWCRKMGRDSREVPLAMEALRLWPEMNSLVGAETGFRRSGIVYLCRTQNELATRQAWLEQVGRPFGLDSRMLTRDELNKVLPGLAGPWLAGLSTPSDGRAEPAHAAPAIAEAARRQGATIATQCAVRGVETSGGRIAAVVTERGRIVCSSVVLAGGVWSRLFCRPLDLRLPQLKVLSSVMRTEPLSGGPEASASGFGFGLRKRLDGGYTVASWSGNVADIVPDSFRFARDFLPAMWMRRGDVRLRLGNRFFEELFQPARWALDRPSPFEAVRVLDPPAHPAIVGQAHAHVTAAFPVFHSMRVAESWGGMIDVTPDEIPVISGVDTVPGFFIATGFTGHGFGIAPGAGRLMAELVMGETPVVDPAPFRYSRFIDGTRAEALAARLGMIGMNKNFPTMRLRRLRSSQVMRDLLQEHTVSVNDLIYPIFVEEDLDDFAPVESMPGIFRIPERKLDVAVKEIAAAGIKAVMTFGVSHNKDDVGSDAWNREGLLARMIKRAKDAAPGLMVISDTCFCEYTSHGHCGVIHDGDVHNDHTIENLGRQSVVAAEAGADMIAPSSMMDGQVSAIRTALDGNGFGNIPIMAYSSKFASAFYGPFRAAAGCDLDGDRKAYQMNPMNGREALRESDVDEAEGADILMVKPAMPYLDVLTRIRQRSLLPLAAYQVSGEYAMIKFAAQAGAIDEHRVMRESLGAIKRAGADLILTYFAMDIAREGF